MSRSNTNKAHNAIRVFLGMSTTEVKSAIKGYDDAVKRPLRPLKNEELDGAKAYVQAYDMSKVEGHPCLDRLQELRGDANGRLDKIPEWDKFLEQACEAVSREDNNRDRETFDWQKSGIAIDLGILFKNLMDAVRVDDEGEQALLQVSFEKLCSEAGKWAITRFREAAKEINRQRAARLKGDAASERVVKQNQGVLNSEMKAAYAKAVSIGDVETAAKLKFAMVTSGLDEKKIAKALNGLLNWAESMGEDEPEIKTGPSTQDPPADTAGPSTQDPPADTASSPS